MGFSLQSKRKWRAIYTAFESAFEHADISSRLTSPSASRPSIVKNEFSGVVGLTSSANAKSPSKQRLYDTIRSQS